MIRGIHTIADLRERCHVDAETGCWHWLGGCDHKGPRVSYRLDGVLLTAGGRRAGLALAGVDVTGRWTRSRACCRSDDCIAPQHSIAETRTMHTRAMKRRGVFAPTPADRARQAVRMAGYRKLTQAEAEAVRADAAAGKTHRAIAAEHGIARGTVHCILIGRTYRPLPAASVWDWRPVAADERRAA